VEFKPFYTYLTTEKRCSHLTVEAYQTDLEQFKAFCRRSYELDDETIITPTIVRSWLAQLVEEQYKVTSVHRKLSSVNAYYKFLQKTGKARTNPARGIPKPKKPGRLPIFLDTESTEKIYRAIQPNSAQVNDYDYNGGQSIATSRSSASPGPDGGHDFYAVRSQMIVTLFYETGIRQSELLNLKDEDIDTYIGQIKVLGKRNKTRYVPVGAEMLKSIATYQKVRDAEFRHREGSWLFVGMKGKKITKTLVYTTVKTYLSGITTLKRKSPHVLRHTFATHMLNNGADLNVIKEILGHSSLAATQVYTHNSIGKLKRIHEQMHPRNNK
jgi:integrase/recombinase XerC